MSQLHEMKKLQQENPGAWENIRTEIAARLNNNNDGKYTREGEIKQAKAARKRKRR